VVYRLHYKEVSDQNRAEGGVILAYGTDDINWSGSSAIARNFVKCSRPTNIGRRNVCEKNKLTTTRDWIFAGSCKNIYFCKNGAGPRGDVVSITPLRIWQRKKISKGVKTRRRYERE